MPRTALHGAKTLEQLAAALQAGADVDAQDFESEFGRTRRGDDARASRRGRGRQQAGLLREDRADARRRV